MNNELIMALYLQEIFFCMKKKLLSGGIALLCLLAACQPGEQSESKQADAAKDMSATEATMPSAAGGDKDKHGCIPSAGYTWSVLKNNCVRLFEEKGVSMDPVNNKETYTAAAVVLFDEGRTKAEVFLPSEQESIILERKSPADSMWKGNDLELVHEQKYLLKKAGATIYQEP